MTAVAVPPHELGACEHALTNEPQGLIAERFKTRMCSNFEMNGWCPYGFRCMFAHGQAELRTLAMNTAAGLTTVDAVKVQQQRNKAAARRTERRKRCQRRNAEAAVAAAALANTNLAAPTIAANVDDDDDSTSEPSSPTQAFSPPCQHTLAHVPESFSASVTTPTTNFCANTPMVVGSRRRICPDTNRRRTFPFAHQPYAAVPRETNTSSTTASTLISSLRLAGWSHELHLDPLPVAALDLRLASVTTAATTSSDYITV